MKPSIVNLILSLVPLLLAVGSGPFHRLSVAVEASPSRGSPFLPNQRRLWGPPFFQKQHDNNNNNNNNHCNRLAFSAAGDIDRHSKLLASLQTKSSLASNGNNNHEDDVVFPRGGQVDMATAVAIPKNVIKFVATVTQVLIQCGNVVLPPVVAIISLVVNFYRALPKDAIVAQVGLVYCFAGGYYPTLFSSLSAAQQFGWHVMVAALQDLTLEAIAVIRALEEHEAKTSSLSSFFTSSGDNKSRALLFRQKTGVVLATVDPVKINQAAGALYTTWLGVSSVLEKEYARVITLSLTMAEYLENMAQFIFGPPARLCINPDYHAWIPVVIGWGCKAAAMNIAWRIQRVMTAATSAITGGLLFARAVARMLSKRGIRLFGVIRPDGDDTASAFDEVVGFLVAGLGFYTQFEAQWRSGFSFRVPFPFYLVTWPFDWAEKWIQWQITKKKS